MDPQDVPGRSSTLDLWLAVLALLAVVAVGTWAIARVKRWREETAVDAAPTPAEQLDHFQKLVADGLLEEDELERIQSRMAAPPQPPPHQPPDTSIQEK